MRLPKRYRDIKTVALALLATGTLVLGGILSFDIPPREMLTYFLISLSGVAVIAIAAFLLGCAVVLVRKWLRGRP